MNDLEHVEIKTEMMQVGARVLARSTPNLPALSVGDGTITLSGDTQAMVDVLIARHVLDAEILTEHPPFFWGAEISSSRLDTYDTKMDVATTLKNFAEDLVTGVAFCDSHNHEELPFGRSFAGLMIDGIIDDLQQAVIPSRVLGAFYTLPGMKTNRVSTDDLILSIRGGTTKDVSVGFKPGPGFMYRCSLCGLDLWDWDCPHIPGIVYEVPDDQGMLVERYAFAWVVNARLSEVSGAFDGSTPYAMILKATREAKAGRIPERVVKLVENRARIHLPEKSITIPVRSKETAMTPEEKLAAEKAVRDQFAIFVRKACTDSGLAGDAIATMTAEQAVESMRSEIGRLKPLADDATRLRGLLIDEVVAEGIRLQGDKFVEATQRTSLAKLDVDMLLERRDFYRTAAEEKFGKVAGRKSGEEADDDPAAATDPVATRGASLPESAFASA